MDRLILLVESRIRGDVYVRFGGELPKTHRSNTAGRWMLSLPNQLAQVYSDLHQNIQDRFNEEGIEIMSPHYIATRDGSATTIPKDDLRPKK